MKNFVWLALLPSLVLSSDVMAFNAITRLTQVPITDADVGSALSSGLLKQYDQVFPDKQYGVRVVAFSRGIPAGQDAVYLSLGLCRRLPNGDFLAEHATNSTIYVQDSKQSLQQKRARMLAALTRLAREYSEAMLASRQKVK